MFFSLAHYSHIKQEATKKAPNVAQICIEISCCHRYMLYVTVIHIAVVLTRRARLAIRNICHALINKQINTYMTTREYERKK